MRAVSVTNRGGRENNEDCVRSACAEDMWCFVLCDGLGGHAGGEVASEIVAATICDEFMKNPQISGDALRDYLTAAAELLATRRIEDEKLYDMSSTVVVLVTDGAQAVWAHVGDSRLYYISGGEIAEITDDHSIAFMEYENGLIEYGDIRRSPNQNKLVRCVGNMDEFIPDISPVTDLEKNDAFLLCSDGFWEYVMEEDVENGFKSSSSPQEWTEKMLSVLHINEVDNNDNYSAIAVMV